MIWSRVVLHPVVGYLAAALALSALKCASDRHARAQAVLSERVRIADSTAGTLRQQVRRVDTVYRRDTVRLAANTQLWRTAIATLGADVDRYRDSVARLTGVAPDTVRVPVEVIRWVTAAADSVVQACQAVTRSCAQRVAVRDSLIGVLQREVALVKRQRPSRVRAWGERALWLAALATLSRR